MIQVGVHRCHKHFHIIHRCGEIWRVGLCIVLVSSRSARAASSRPARLSPYFVTVLFSLFYFNLELTVSLELQIGCQSARYGRSDKIPYLCRFHPRSGVFAITVGTAETYLRIHSFIAGEGVEILYTLHRGAVATVGNSFQRRLKSYPNVMF